MEIGVHTMEVIYNIIEKLLKRVEDPALDLGLDAHERSLAMCILRDKLEEMDKEFKGAK